MGAQYITGALYLILMCQLLAHYFQMLNLDCYCLDSCVKWIIVLFFPNVSKEIICQSLLNGIFIQRVSRIKEYRILIECFGFCYIIFQKTSRCCHNTVEFI